VKPRVSSLAVVLGVATLFRALVFFEIRDSPILHLHHWTETDNAFYDWWARTIVAGDLLSVHDVRPFHSWHGHVARAVHDASGSREPLTEAEGRRIWDQWLGPRTFYQDPLYPYFLAALYAPFGRNVRLVFLVQAVLGLVGIALLWAITRRLWDDGVALGAGLMAALYGPLVLYENVLLRTTLINVTGIATLWLAIRAFREPRPRRFTLLGLAGAIAALATSGAWIFLLVVAALIPARLSDDRRAALRAVAAFGLGLLMGLSPLVARNLTVGVSPFSLASSGAITFVNHNAADYDPTGGTAMSAHAAGVMQRSGGRMLPAIRETIATHGSFGRWLLLLGRKFASVWHWYEVPNNESYEYLLLHSPLILAVGLSFGLVAPLALVGLAIGCRRSWEHTLAVAYLGSGVATLVLLYNLGRLRLPTAFALIPFAAFAIVTVLRMLAARRLGRASALVAAAAALALVVLRPLPASRSPVRLQDYGVGNEIALRLAELRLAVNDERHALRLVERQLQTEPRELRDLNPTGSTSRLSLFAADLAGSFAPLHRMCAELFERTGHHLEAAEQRRRWMLLNTVAIQRAQASSR
jgi:hypothetical protein